MLNIKVYKAVIVPGMCGHEALSCIPNEEHKLKVSEDLVLQIIFGPKQNMYVV
jgi:hypothetical protein